MVAWSSVLLAISLPLLVLQGMVQDPVQALYSDAMAAAEGLPALVRRLDEAARSNPASPFLPQVLEAIQIAGILHPGLIPDRESRLEEMKAAAASRPDLARTVQRLTVLGSYYAGIAVGRAEQAAAALKDPVLEGWKPRFHALADAAFRAGDHARAEALAYELIESDPYSPLIADARLLLGFCGMARARVPAAAREFQRALALTALPTVYGSAREYAQLSYRFARPSPGAVNGFFEEATVTRISGIQGLDDPRSLRFHGGKYFLADKEQVYTLSSEGKANGAKVSRRLVDLAPAGEESWYYLAEDGVDLGSGKWARLTWSSGGRERTLANLQSLALDRNGTVYLLDQDAGVLRGSPGGDGLTLTPVAAVKGRLLRIDRRNNLFVLAWDRRSISVLSQEGKPVATITPVSIGGKTPSIEYFALDALDHVYILDTGGNSIQIYALNPGGSGLEAVSVLGLPLDQRPHTKNLRVLAVSSTGEVAVTGKNDDNWVLYR